MKFNDALEYKSFSGTDMVATMLINIPGKDKIKKKSITLGSLQTVTYSIHMDRKPVRSLGNVNVKDYLMGPRTIAGTLIFAVFNKHFSQDIISSIKDETGVSSHILADELPPFDITISLANEYGAQSRLVIYGIRLVNEGQVMSVNDIYTENTYQYVATDLEYISDLNSYSDNTNKNKSNVIGKETLSPDYIISGKDIVIDYREEKKPDWYKKYKGSIKIDSVSPTKQNKKGKVHIEFAKEKDPGYLRVFDMNEKLLMQDRMNSSLKTMSLFPGDYYMDYISADSSVTTPKKHFKIEGFKEKTTPSYAAPIVNHVSDTYLYLDINNKEHRKVIIKEEGAPNRTINTYDYNNIKIDKLKNKTKYALATMSEDEKAVSDFVQIRTLETKDERFELLKAHIKANDQLLNNKDISAYYDIINKALLEYKDHESLSEQTAIFLVLKKATEDKEIDMCYELISIADTILQTSYDSMAPVLIDSVNNVFSLDKSVSKLRIFIFNKDAYEFYTEVTFKDIAKDGTYRFKGKSGNRYFIQSFDNNNIKSHQVEFVIADDNNKSLEVVKDKENKKILESIYKRLKQNNELFGKELIKDVAAVMLYNKAEREILGEPSVKRVKDSLLVSTDYNSFIGKSHLEYYVVMCETKDVFTDKLRVKKKVINGLEDEILIGNIEEEKIYAVWIEDMKNRRISNASIVNTFEDNDELASDLEQVREVFIKDKLENISKELRRVNSLDDNIKDIIENLKSYFDISPFELYDEIIRLVISLRGYCDYSINIIRRILQIKFYLEFEVENSFNEDIKINYPIVTLPSTNSNLIWNIVSINFNDRDERALSYELLSIDANNTYNIDINELKADCIVIYALEENLYSKSDFIFIDTIGRKLNGDKI